MGWRDPTGPPQTLLLPWCADALPAKSCLGCLRSCCNNELPTGAKITHSLFAASLRSTFPRGLEPLPAPLQVPEAPTSDPMNWPPPAAPVPPPSTRYTHQSDGPILRCSPDSRKDRHGEEPRNVWEALHLSEYAHLFLGDDSS